MVVLIGLNYIPVVLYSLDLSVNVGTVLGVVVFHLLLGLMLLSWAYTCCTDPGNSGIIVVSLSRTKFQLQVWHWRVQQSETCLCSVCGRG